VVQEPHPNILEIPALKPDIPAAAFVISSLSHDTKNASEILWNGLAENISAGLNRLARLNHDAEVECGIRGFRIRDYLELAVNPTDL
jgi:hypothetical protein